MLISIEDTNLIQKMSAKKSPYVVQTAYVHTINPDGSPKRYPEQISLFPKKDAEGNAVPYKKGDYTLGDKSFQVERGFLQLNFPELVPVKA